MHELSLVESLLEQIKEHMEREKAEKLLSLTLVIGDYSGVDREAFEFAYQIATENTPFAAAELIIEETQMTLRCLKCQKESQPEGPWGRCLECGSAEVEVVDGKDFLLKEILIH